MHWARWSACSFLHRSLQAPASTAAPTTAASTTTLATVSAPTPAASTPDGSAPREVFRKARGETQGGIPNRTPRQHAPQSRHSQSPQRPDRQRPNRQRLGPGTQRRHRQTSPLPQPESLPGSACGADRSEENDRSTGRDPGTATPPALRRQHRPRRSHRPCRPHRQNRPLRSLRPRRQSRPYSPYRTQQAAENQWTAGGRRSEDHKITGNKALETMGSRSAETTGRKEVDHCTATSGITGGPSPTTTAAASASTTQQHNHITAATKSKAGRFLSERITEKPAGHYDARTLCNPLRVAFLQIRQVR